MPRKVHTIHSLPADAPWQGGKAPQADSDTVDPSGLIRAIDVALRVQRPAVLAHLRGIRLRHPDVTPDQLIRILERRYLAAVTTTGAAAGATAVVPGVGTGIALAISGAETVGFLEATALFAQSVTEVHGIRLTDPDRARALVLTLMLGSEGTALIRQFAGEASGRAAARGTFWGDLITKTIPRAAMGPVLDRLKHLAMTQLAKIGGASVIGKVMPFGIGAVVGGGGNHLLGRRVVSSSRTAFGPAPMIMPAEIEPKPGSQPLESHLGHAARGAARTLGTVASSGGRAASRAGSAAIEALRRPRGSAKDSPAPEVTTGEDSR
ncbi:hypothetical protein [Microbacterium gorillae]|uniref:hypothetical protein n=1 Tax=Microbacterium gorillae TaxID=1231063 RepID=UPI003D97E67B